MRRLIVALVVVIGVLLPVPAWGCSQIKPPTLDELLQPNAPLGELLGVYEQQHIAGTPNLFVRDVRTVSVVTRYWGQPPSLDREMHGDTTFLGSSSCGNQSGRVGERGFGYVTEGVARSDDRNLTHSAIGQGGLSTREEARLVEMFGPPVELDIAWFTRLGAHAQLWVWPVVVGIPLSMLLGWAIGRASRRYRPVAADPLKPHPQ